MKKIFSLFLIVLLNLAMITPVFAEENTQTQDNAPENNQYNSDDTSPTFSTSVEDEKVYLKPKTTFQLEFESDFDVNALNDNEEIYFRLVSPVQASNGMYLPEDTRFVGKCIRLSKSKPLFKRARAYIVIDKMIIPNENSYNLRMEPQKSSDLKSPQGLNILRAIPAGIGVLTLSVISVAVVAVESVSIVGLVVVPRTCNGFGLAISSMAKGLNYKAKSGDQIVFKLNSPVYVTTSDLKK